MSIQESGEMYLENILILSNTKGAVRSVDVSDYMALLRWTRRAILLLPHRGVSAPRKYSKDTIYLPRCSKCSASRTSLQSATRAKWST